MTTTADRLLTEEAERRARGEHRDERIPTKVLAAQTGLTYGYVANVISRKRREIEGSVAVSVKRQRRLAKSPDEFERIVSEARDILA